MRFSKIGIHGDMRLKEISRSGEVYRLENGGFGEMHLSEGSRLAEMRLSEGGILAQMCLLKNSTTSEMRFSEIGTYSEMRVKEISRPGEVYRLEIGILREMRVSEIGSPGEMRLLENSTPVKMALPKYNYTGEVSLLEINNIGRVRHNILWLAIRKRRCEPLPHRFHLILGQRRQVARLQPHPLGNLGARGRIQILTHPAIPEPAVPRAQLMVDMMEIAGFLLPRHRRQHVPRILRRGCQHHPVIPPRPTIVKTLDNRPRRQVRILQRLTHTPITLRPMDDPQTKRPIMRLQSGDVG